MSIFEWDNSYLVGNQILDDQHKYLFKLMNKLNLAFIAKDKDKIIDETVIELSSFVKYHRQSKLNYLVQKNLPENLTIKYDKLCSDFIKDIERFETMDFENTSAKLQQIIYIVNNCVLNHIVSFSNTINLFNQKSL